MKTMFLGLVLSCAGLTANGSEWIPYVPNSVVQPVVMQQPVMIQYVYVPVVPPAPQYVPVTSYQNVLVERRYHCFFKRIEVLSVPQTVYVPIRY
jgi:hypothetical protein